MNIPEIIKGLEEKLLLPETRKDKIFLEKVLSEEFIEFGASGVRYDRAAVLAALENEPDSIGVCEIEQFACNILNDQLVHATYCIKSNRSSLRSSMWRHSERGWQMLFHQGTYTN